MKVRLVKSALPEIFIRTTQLVGVTVHVLDVLPAVQLEKFLVINVLLDHVIVKLESGCAQSEPLPNNASLNAEASINHDSNLPAELSKGILFSSHEPLDVFAVFTGFINNLAPLPPVAVWLPCSDSVASSATHCVDVLALTGVIIACQYVVFVGKFHVLASIQTYDNQSVYVTTSFTTYEVPQA